VKHVASKCSQWNLMLGGVTALSTIITLLLNKSITHDLVEIFEDHVT
jgi:hypothetical protein